MKKFFKNLMPMLLLVAGLGISPNAWAATGELPNGSYLYCNVTNTNWSSDGAKMRFNLFYNKDDFYKNVNGTNLTGNIWYTKIDNAYVRYVQMLRMSSDWKTQWNYSNSIYVSGRSNDKQNCVSITGSNWDQASISWGTYVPPMKSLTIANNGTTTISGSGTEASPYIIAAGATIKVKATAALQVDDSNPTFKYKYKVDGVEGSYGDGNNTYQFTAGNDAHTYAVTVRAYATYNSTDNTAINASNTIYFQVPSYTISYSPSTDTGQGFSYATAPLTGVYGETVSMTINPKTGYTIAVSAVNSTTSDAISLNKSSNTYTFTMPASNVAVTVTPTETKTTVTISSNGNGSVDPTSANVGVATTQSVSATPADGYHFASWAVTGNADIKSKTTDNPVTLYGNGSGSTGTLKATFAETLYTVTIVSGTAASTTAGCVTKGTATAAAAATGKKFDKWELGAGITLVGCAVSDETITFHASQEATVTATYTDASKYNLNVVAGTGISAVTGEKLNQTALPIVSEISATAKTGYTFAQWTKSGEGTVTYTTGSETSANATVSVTIGSVTLTASATPNTNTAYTVKHYQQNLADDGYTLVDTDNLTGTTDAQVTPDVKNYDGFTAPSTQTVTIAGDGSTTVTYNYTRDSYNISYTAQATGWTYGEKPGTAKYEQEVSFVVTPTAGYTVTVTSEDVTLNATSAPTYTFTMPAKAVAISVSASENKYDVTVDNGNGSTTVQAGVATHPQITAADKADKIFVQWTCTGGASVANESDKTTTVSATATGTVTATYRDKTLVKLYFANNDGWEAVAAYAYGNGEGNNNKWPGEVITSNTEVINCVTYYYFQYYTEDHDWTYVIFNNNNNGKQTGDLTIAGNNGKYYSMIENDGNGAWLTTPYDALWAFYIQKSNNKDGADHIVDCESGKATATLEANTHYIFKAHNKVTGKWYGNNNGDENYWIKNSVENWEFEENHDDKTFGDCNMKTTEAGNYFFTVASHSEDHKVKVSVTYPAATTYKVTISAGEHGSVSPVGEKDIDEYVGTQVTATPDAHYTFANWEKSEGITTTSEEATTTVKASQAGTLKANFKGSWTVRGQFNDWAEGNFIENFEGNVGYVDITLAASSNYEFLVYHHNDSDSPYGNTGTMNRNNCSGWTMTTNTGNCKIITDVAGTYRFSFNVNDHTLTVTYPEETKYAVIVSADANGSVEPSGEQQMGPTTPTEITATPNPGYHFVEWQTSEHVYVAAGYTQTSNPCKFNATATGTVTAVFAQNTSIYFNNTMQDAWGTDSMFVYFYKNSDYWNGDKGTGSQTSNASFIAGPCKMTRISKTNIWEYAYDPTTVTGIVGVVFADRRMNNYEYFTECNATRRMDFKDCANMFVLSSESPKETKNGSANYYSTGFWRGYNSEESKMYMHIREGETMKYEGEMKAAFVGSDTYSFTTRMEGNKTYNLYIGNCTGMNFSNHVKITSEDCTGIRLYEYATLDNLGWIDAAASGDYTFSLTFDNDKMYLSVEYPITPNDYRVKIGDPVRYSNIIRAAEVSGTISMYLNAGENVFTYEEATNVDKSPIEWGNTKTINYNNTEAAGVYTMTLTKGETPTITNVQPYKGNYYIRTDCAQGGWNEYKTNDNNLMRFTDRNPKFVNNSNEGFNYYYCRWNTNGGGNVRFVVANEINACISDTLKEDAWLDEDEFLKGAANIRFGYNSNINALSRAYISGAYDDAKYMQIRSNDDKLFEYTQEETKPVITAKSFADENDWTYTMDVLADGGAQVAVSAYYNNKYQSFVGGVQQGDGTIIKTEQLLEAGTKQHLRLVYDFKTDRLISGWMPSGDITETIVLNADMLLVREAQESAAQINIRSAGVEIQEIKTIYSVLQLNRSTMTDGLTQTDSIYARNIYWFSLPFDVAVNDIFGIDGYGTKWVLQYYDGDLRSRIGFFAETETFWTYLGINDTVKANVGYALCLDPDFFDDEDDAIWANGRQSVSFYFPSADRDLKIVGNGTKTVPVPEHKCTIDRTFGEHNEKNHKITDTDWNVIGSPAFQDLTGTAEMCTMHALYQWNPTTNGYNVAAVDGFNFLATHAYLVQFHGDINWQEASIINHTVTPAPRYAYADEKNYTVELMFYFGEQWDRTYVSLKDNANEDFVLSEDLTKMMNAGQPNIYSYAGAYDVAYNGTAFKNQIVNLGVVARKAGTYTFAMPKEFSGTAQLVDLEEGTITDLNVSNYSVDLNKGTYNNRFQLVLEVEAKVPTSIQADRLKGGEAEGKTLKLLRNGNIYLINGGRVYNATGAELR